MAQTKHYVTIEVLVEGTGDNAQFVSAKVEGGSPVPLPKDAPTPRRFVQDILAAAQDSKHPANRDSEQTTRAVSTAKTDTDKGSPKTT